MTGLLDRNYKKVWLGAISAMAYLIMEKDQGRQFIPSQPKNNQLMTVIYRRPFCPIATVFHTDLDNLAKEEFWDNLRLTIKNQPGAVNKWVLMTPFGSHQILATNPRGEVLTGYYSRIFRIPVFPFSRLNK